MNIWKKVWKMFFAPLTPEEEEEYYRTHPVARSFASVLANSPTLWQDILFYVHWIPAMWRYKRMRKKHFLIF